MEQDKNIEGLSFPIQWGEQSLAPLPDGLSEAPFSACVSLVLDWEERGDTAGELVIRIWKVLTKIDR